SFYGLGTLSLAQIFAAFAMIPLSLAYVGVLTAMPRTGGDYVFSSRILSPLLGWLETWMLLFTILVSIGFEILQISITTSGFATVMSVIYPYTIRSFI